jgi:orotate phosphoribosyltransferase
MNQSVEPLREHLRPEEVQERMQELGALLRGHFQLSSGLHSDRYFQCAAVLQYPQLARELGRLLGEQANELETDFVLSPAVGGLLLGHEVARALGRRHVYCERREGKMVLRRGFEILKGERALLVDDVLTRGTSVREMLALVEDNEAQCNALAVIVDRREPDVDVDIPVYALLAEEVQTYDPKECPLCQKGEPLTSPGSRHVT